MRSRSCATSSPKAIKSRRTAHARPPVPAAEAARQRAQRRRLRRQVMGAVFAVPLFLLACALYLAFGPKPPPPPLVLPVTPRQADQAERHIDAVRQALTEPQASSMPSTPARAHGADAMTPPESAHPTPIAPSPVRHSTGPQGEDVMTLQLSEADINAYLSGSKKLKATLEARGVHAVTIDLAPPNLITFHAAATLQGLTGNAQVSAMLTPDPKTAVHLTITEARLGRLPPPVVKAAADQIVGHFLGSPKHPLPLTVRTVEVRGTNLILTGVESEKNTASPPQ